MAVNSKCCGENRRTIKYKIFIDPIENAKQGIEMTVVEKKYHEGIHDGG